MDGGRSGTTRRTGVLPRLRAWESRLYDRIEVTGARSTARVVVPAAWLSCGSSIVVLLTHGVGGRNALGDLALAAAAMLLTAPLLFCGRRTATYLYLLLFLVAPWMVLSGQLGRTDPVAYVTSMVNLVLFPLVASGLWSSRRGRPVVGLAALMCLAVLLAGYLRGSVPGFSAGTLAALVVTVTAHCLWSSNQSDRTDVDPLTGLLNQQRLRADLDRWVGRVRAGEQRPGVHLVLLDIDGLAGLNASLGYSRADQLLRESARALVSALPAAAVVYHLGAGGFAALVPGTDRRGEPAGLARSALPEAVTGCVGLAVLTETDTARSLVSRAQASLQRAKSGGAGSLDPLLEGEWMTRELAEGIDRGDFRVVYQPIVDLRTGATVGAEALVRWVHPDRGTIAPDAFIHLAEEIGLIHRLGRHVLSTACAEAAAAERDGRVLERLNVNVSPHELQDPGYADGVLGILRATGLDPRRLVLELTESTLSSGDTDVLAILARLRSAGIRVAIDDFGTGYSSLSRLAQLPIDILKIDKSFVWSSESAGRDHLLAAITALAHAFGVHTVAEGIENDEQAALLLGHGCGFGQGYLYGRPGRFEDLFARPAVVASATRVRSVPRSRATTERAPGPLPQAP